MEYQKTNISAFAGLENNKRPELIEDQQASDIENLRFDKLGYLVNRNGVKVRRVYEQRIVFGDIVGDLWPIGTVGLGEYILDQPFGSTSPVDGVAPYDDATLGAITSAGESDRFLVAAIRIPSNLSTGAYQTDSYNTADTGVSDIADALNWRYKMAYVLMPQTGTGPWYEEFAFAPNGATATPNPDNTLSTLYATIGSRAIARPDDTLATLQTYAPMRRLGEHNNLSEITNGIDGTKWIENYVQMRQYRKSVTIADRTNGDLQLVDELHEADYDQEKKHRFSLRQNAVAEFDIDDVIVDFGVGGNGFNEVGVKAPLVLYRFYLQRRRGTPTVDNYRAYYTQAADLSPTLEKDYLGRVLPNPAQNIWALWQIPKAETCFSLAEYWGDPLGNYAVSGMSMNNQRRYCFSSNENGEEIDDLFSALSFENPDAEDDAGISPSPYRWEDLETVYYPVNGTNQNQYFLTAADRDWDRLEDGTKIVKLKTLAGIEQEVPLGIWRYRFIWDLGNGEYSAPSSELIVPDLLFSPTKNADIFEASNSYARPLGISSESDAYRTAIELATSMDGTVQTGGLLFFNQSREVQAPKFVYALQKPNLIYPWDADTLSSYARSFIAVKEALYNADHQYAAKESSSLGDYWPTDWTNESAYAIGEVSVIATVFFPDNIATLSGVVCETANSSVSSAGTWSNYDELRASYNAQALQLLVPLFSDESESYMYNSVFTDTGVPRMVYQNKPSIDGTPSPPLNALNPSLAFYPDLNYDNTKPAYQIVFSGQNRYGIGGDAVSVAELYNDVAKGAGSVYYNLVPAFGQNIELMSDNNNEPGSTLRGFTAPGKPIRDARNMTISRGVRDETKRLLNIKADIPPQVLARILVQGTAEFTLADYGDKGTWTGQITSLNTDILKRTETRIFTDTERTESGRTMWWTTNAQIVYQRDKVFGGSTSSILSDTTFDFENVKIVLAGRGERLTIPEQLTSFFPASIVFEAPHVKLVIPADRIPRRARRLLIFRTRASHDNAWQPHEYGLAKAIDIKRNASGALSGEHATEISFLDNVKSNDLDFSYDLNTYEAFTEPLKSRFCLPLNERVYYSNFVETYRPRRPRLPFSYSPLAGDTSGITHANRNLPNSAYATRLWSWITVENAEPLNNIANSADWLYYFLGYEDEIGAVSLQAATSAIDRAYVSSSGSTVAATDPNKVVGCLYCLPSQYSPIVSKARIYRLATPTEIPTIRPYPATTATLTPGRVYYVLQGVVEYNGDLYYPTDVIRAVSATDTGVAAGSVGKAIDAFKGAATYTGIHGTHGDFILYDLTDYLGSSPTGPYIEKIGTIEPDAEGVFYDNDLSSLGRLTLRDLFPNLETLESGLRWSEPYTPNKIKLGSLIEVRAGDGDQITGMEALYGNIVILKERSIHRIAVQSAGVPVSRIDEISNTVGCIAPNTVLCINNELFFLSWSGFYRYNNNVLQKMDIPFSEELQLRLRNGLNGEPDPAIRDASCAWNPTYREIYLNIPIMSTVLDGATVTDEYDDSVTLTDSIGTRQVRGVVYALNVDTGLATKYRYGNDSRAFGEPVNQLTPQTDATNQRAARTYGRLYHTTSLGKLMSAEILPPRTINYITIDNPTQRNRSRYFLDSTFYLESPTKQDFNQFDKADDEFLYYRASPSGFGGTSKNIGRRLVRTYWRSKTWTAEDKSVLKRFRKAFAYIASTTDPVIIRGITHTSPEGATQQTFTTWSYQYDSGGSSVTGELLAVPSEAHQSNLLGPAINRGERYTFEVEAGGRVQMEYFGFYWKPINTYER